jgi:hypothetical protein
MGELSHNDSDEQLTLQNLRRDSVPEQPARYPAGLLYMPLVEVKLVGPTLDTSRPEDSLPLEGTSLDGQ